MFNKTRKIMSARKVWSKKVTHMRTCRLFQIVKKNKNSKNTIILHDSIKANSRYEISKAFFIN